MQDLRRQIGGITRDADGGPAPEGDVPSTAAQLAAIRREFNLAHERTSKATAELTALRDQYTELEKEGLKEAADDTPTARKIRTLENRLDKAMIKFNEAQSIRKTYEQIIRRLREERVGFDQQLVTLERTMAAKVRDYDELMLLSGDAAHAKDSAIGELEKVGTIAASPAPRPTHK